MEFNKPNIFISKCIEHGHCRYDGSMISSEFVKKLEPYVNYLYSCPEMDIGLPSPREALRIIVENGVEKIVSSKSGKDVTEDMVRYAEIKADELKNESLDGFILKGRSPSCGVKDVKMYKSFGKAPAIPQKTSGVFGGIIDEKFNLLPVEDEGRLTNFSIREHFYTRIFTTAKFRIIKKNMKLVDLVKFHSDNKYLFMAYNQGRLKTLGKIVANHEKKKADVLYKEYEAELLELLKTPASSKRKMNVALHILGYFSNDLSSKEKAYFLDLMQQYVDNQIPFSNLVAVLEMWAIRFDIDYLNNQSIFNPFPKDLIKVTDSGKGL
ncbi:MAG: DUF1722 domain-containing protein [Bacillota bacterium]|nr:DUF1722 domain-containing protein [Bacillota bacterium]